jgi:hypothetical protein
MLPFKVLRDLRIAKATLESIGDSGKDPQLFEEDFSPSSF